MKTSPKETRPKPTANPFETLVACSSVRFLNHKRFTKSSSAIAAKLLRPLETVERAPKIEKEPTSVKRSIE